MLSFQCLLQSDCVAVWMLLFTLWIFSYSVHAGVFLSVLLLLSECFCCCLCVLLFFICNSLNVLVFLFSILGTWFVVLRMFSFFFVSVILYMYFCNASNGTVFHRFFLILYTCFVILRMILFFIVSFILYVCFMMRWIFCCFCMFHYSSHLFVVSWMFWFLSVSCYCVVCFVILFVCFVIRRIILLLCLCSYSCVLFLFMRFCNFNVDVILVLFDVRISIWQ